MKIPRPSWMRDALCLEYPAKWWFPEVHVPARNARTVCKECLVRKECLTFAIEHHERYGIWAGYDQHDFRRWHRYRQCRLCWEPIPFAEVAALVLTNTEPGRWCCNSCREQLIEELVAS